MDQIEHPPLSLWQQRRAWFEALFDVENRGGGYLIGEQALGMLIDLQAAYSAGAFLACVILSCTIVDAHIRETETKRNSDGGIRSAFDRSDFREELEWLRKRRNRLVHFKAARPLAVSVGDHYDRRNSHEEDPRRAITLVASVFFENPWI